MLIAVGFSIVLLGVASALLMDDRVAGATIFVVGFIVITLGTVVNILRSTRRDDDLPGSTAVRVGILGFTLIVIGALVSITVENERIFEIVFGIGFVIVGAGILTAIINVLRTKR